MSSVLSNHGEDVPDELNIHFGIVFHIFQLTRMNTNGTMLC